MTEAEVTVYGTLGCSGVRWCRRYLDDRGVPYRWVDVNRDPGGLRLVREANNGRRVVPTIVFRDGSVLVDPTGSELAAALGLAPRPTGARLALGAIARWLRRRATLLERVLR